MLVYSIAGTVCSSGGGDLLYISLDSYFLRVSVLIPNLFYYLHQNRTDRCHMELNKSLFNTGLLNLCPV